jgi:predicted signal transduction protein with EAL and GGDEF domain
MLLRSNNIDITNLIDRVLKALQQPMFVSEHELKISGSIGIAVLGVDANNLSDLMRYADMALYKAKQNGRNTYHYFSEQLEANVIKRNKILNDLAIAIVNNQLELFYQTLHDINDRRVTGIEALIRWPQPDGSYIFPDEFIPLAEESGLIMALGEWIINRACRDGKVLNQLAGPLVISINLSTRQFEDPALLDKIIASCQTHDLAHKLVQLEITESLLLNDLETGVKTLEGMRRKGFQIALDDFGTGYSSMF